ncbi:MAG: tRNA (adenosine(37)-N6)-dimethylallyltransferase MiaA [Bdellovibrionales bacterium]|nr:tRNA (adenosine(37)-N6)-dimethylallyltransferase MiaA [Bdellovibrionales bacterium]
MSVERQRIAVITGPTASGKSGAALQAALAVGGSIINADSVSVYEDFNIGSSKPSAADLKLVPHYLVSRCRPTEDFNAGVFSSMADEAIAAIRSAGRLPLVVGGTGLYISALLGGLIDTGKVSDDAKEQIALRVRGFAGEQSEVALELHRWLTELDPLSAQQLNPRDSARVVRALEVFLSTGESLAELQREHVSSPRYDALIAAILPPRDELYKAIDDRVDRMIADGLLDEVESLLQRYPANARAFASIGYSHAAAFINQQIPYEQMLNDMKRDTRRFAKRQLTWWRNQPGKLGWHILEPVDYGHSEGDSAEMITDIVARFFESERPFFRPGSICFLKLSSADSCD